MKNTKNTGNPGKEVVGLMNSGETCTLAVSMENGWSVMDDLWLFHLPNKSRNDGHLFELTGPKMVCIYSKLICFNKKNLAIPEDLLDSRFH
ncbi:hypothetical protein, partial [Escherichia coli]|uniref:hypothetical protein n=1 Tax=Escherichia coli TaxID=562 RepID=UPI001956E553